MSDQDLSPFELSLNQMKEINRIAIYIDANVGLYMVIEINATEAMISAIYGVNG